MAPSAAATLASATAALPLNVLRRLDCHVVEAEVAPAARPPPPRQVSAIEEQDERVVGRDGGQFLRQRR